MKVLFATDQYMPTPGGIAVVTYRLARALTKRGHTVGIIAPSTSWTFEKEHKDGFTVFRVQSIPLFKTKKLRYAPTFLYSNAIKKIIKTFKPDIIHLETPNDIARTAADIARKQGIPIIGTCHIMPENISGALPFLPSQVGKVVGNLYMHQMIQIFNKIDFVTAPTQTGIAILKAYGITTPLQALSNGIDMKEFSEPPLKEKESLKKKLDIPEKVPLVLYIGRLDKEKRVEVLIDALFKLPSDVEFHALIAGTGNETERLQEQVQELSLLHKVSFIGLVDKKDLPVLYSLATVFVMPSTAELQSLVTMEAMCLKLPIIAAQAGALPYLVKDGENGFLFKPNNAKDLAAKIEILLKNKELREKMGKKSFDLIKLHDISHITDLLVSLYSQLIAKKNREYTRNVPLSARVEG